MTQDHSEPTYENQLWHARKLLREKGREAVNNPHAMIGRDCKCGDCFCCAAAQVLREPYIQQFAPGLYDLYYNGKVVIAQESFSVCEQVRDSLVAGRYDDSETGEVARRIADAVKGN
jgi:hypothetical protein